MLIYRGGAALCILYRFCFQPLKGITHERQFSYPIR